MTSGSLFRADRKVIGHLQIDAVMQLSMFDEVQAGMDAASSGAEESEVGGE